MADSDDELLKRLDEPVTDGYSYRAVVINGQQHNPLHVAAAARIRELIAERDEAVTQMVEAKVERHKAHTGKPGVKQ